MRIHLVPSRDPRRKPVHLIEFSRTPKRLDEALLQVRPENDQLPYYDALCRLNQCKTDLVDAGFPLRGILRESFPSKPEDPRVLEPPSHAKLFVGPKLYLQLPHLLKAAVGIIKKKNDGKSPDAAVASVLQSRHAIVDEYHLEAVLAVLRSIPSKHGVYIKNFAVVKVDLLVREHKEHEEHKDDASSALPAWCCRQLNRPRLDAGLEPESAPQAF